MKVGVVGAGRVGAACALSLVLRGSAREVVIVDRTRARALAVVTDLRYGAPLCPEVVLRDGDYADLAGADLVMLAAGINEKSGGATERDVRYANITIIEGNEASQFGIGIVSARIAETVLRDERAVLPIGVYNPQYGVTLSLPSVVGREGVNRILEPAMSDEERRALDQSAEVLRQAVQRTSQIP
jgi:malate/lactate dehydrogenase